MKTHSILRFLLSIPGLALLTPARADFQNGQPGDRVLGDVRLPHHVMEEPRTMAIDPVSGKVFLNESRRILRFSSTVAYVAGAAAEAVLGQPDFNYGTPMPDPAYFVDVVGVVCDWQGRLWVADRGRDRVFMFSSAAGLPNGAAADLILGDGDPAPTARSLRPRALAVDHNGRLWVADEAHSRVLRFENAANLTDFAPASGVLGQPDFTSNGFGTGPSSMGSLRGVAVEEKFSDGEWISRRLWVSDSSNNRVLRFELPATDGAPADGVLGQPNFTSSSFVAGAAGMTQPRMVQADAGRLWVGDSGRNRVLRFDNAGSLANGAAASGVLGQPDFTTTTAGSTTSKLNAPYQALPDGSRLWVTDRNNYRVCLFNNAAALPNGAAAGAIAGWPGGINPTVPSSFIFAPGTLASPVQKYLAVDPATGKLFICDTNANRILRYRNATAIVTREAPELIFDGGSGRGISLNRPTDITVDAGGYLWVADTGNHRVLRYPNAALTPAADNPPSLVLGKPNYTDTAAPAVVSASTMNAPQGIAVWGTGDGINGRVFVADTGNHRILRFSNGLLTDGTAAVAVVGQSNFTTATSGNALNKLNAPRGLDFSPGINSSLWVADSGNSRVLRFAGGPSTATNDPADRTFFSPGGPTPLTVTGCTDVDAAANGRLWITDPGNNRVLWMDNANALPSNAPATSVLGAPNLNTLETCGWLHCLRAPSSIAQDKDGHLWVADNGSPLLASGHVFNRVLRFTPVVQLIGSPVMNSSTISITFQSERGIFYDLRSSTDLQADEFMQVFRTHEDTIEGDGSLKILTARIDERQPRKFFTVQQQ